MSHPVPCDTKITKKAVTYSNGSNFILTVLSCKAFPVIFVPEGLL